MGHGGALALACALAFVADVEAKVGARRGGGYSIVNTGQGGDLDTATTVVILCFVGLAVIFCAFGAFGARRLTRYRARYDASRALEELDLGTLTPGTKVTLRHNGVDIDGVGTVLGSSEPHGDRVQIEWPPSTPSHFTYRPDGPRGRKMRVERKAWWPRASVVPYTEPPEDTIECEAPARDPPRETTPALPLASFLPLPLPPLPLPPPLTPPPRHALTSQSLSVPSEHPPISVCPSASRASEHREEEGREELLLLFPPSAAAAMAALEEELAATPLESIPTLLVSDTLLSQRCTLPAASPTANADRTVEGHGVVQDGAAVARETPEERKAASVEEEEVEREEEELGSITAVAYRRLGFSPSLFEEEEKMASSSRSKSARAPEG